MMVGRRRDLHGWAMPQRRALDWGAADVRRTAALGGTLLVHVALLMLLFQRMAETPHFPRPRPAAITIVGIDGDQADGTAPSPDADDARQVAPSAAADVVVAPVVLPATVETIRVAPIVADADAPTRGAAPAGADSASSAGAGFDPYAGAAPLPLTPQDCHVRLHLAADQACPAEDKDQDGGPQPPSR